MAVTANEKIEVALVTQGEFKEMAAEGEFVEATRLAAYFLGALKGCFAETLQFPASQVQPAG